MADSGQSELWQRKAERERRGRVAAERLSERLSEELRLSRCVLAARTRELEQRLAIAEAGMADAESRSKAKMRLLANISHEVRTPLNGLVGTLELLRETPLLAEQQRLVDAVMSCVDSLLDLINSVLDTSRMDAGQIKLASDPCNLRQIVEGSVEMFDAMCQAKNVRLEFVGISDQSPWILGDEVRIKQIVNNLVSNAAKFTDSGTIDVRLSLQAMAIGHIAVTVSVSDTGVGIPQADQERIFEEFEQVDTSSARIVGGTGLGLSIARQLARMMGGDITLQSEVGRGSTFAFALLAREAEPPEGMAAVDPAASLENLRVLVVDDNAQNRMIASRMLAAMGCRVASAEHGLRALEIMESGVFDLVLLDGQMPVMPGDQVAQVIRDPKSAVRNHDVAILCVTADVVSERLQHYLASGMDAVLTKPFRKSGLRQAVVDVVRRVGRP